jgi:type VI secretion system protein ImpH
MAAAGRGFTAPLNLDVENSKGTGPGHAVARGTRSSSSPPASAEPTVAERLFQEGFAFDFFQAVRLLEKLDPARKAVGRGGPPAAEVVRFRAHLSLTFPPSSIYEILRPTPEQPLPIMVVTFLGLFGPSGILPRHYTEMLLRLERESKSREKRALREWLDLFNHRLISLFFRAWEKYRFFIPYERRAYARPDPDTFTLALFSLEGLGERSLRGRLRVALWEVDEEEENRERVLAHIDDLALLYYAGLLGHRPRCVVALEALLGDFFQLPVRVQQFQGQWLRLDTANQSQLGVEDGNCRPGVNLVAGERVWDVQTKFRVCLGPLRYAQFNAFLPDRAPIPERKAFFLLSQLVRLYAGPELDFDVQLLLQAEEVPECRLDEAAGGPRLGWNTWLRSRALARDAGDAIFDGEELVWLNQPDFRNALNGKS